MFYPSLVKYGKGNFKYVFFTIVDKYFMSLNYIQILIQIKEQQDRQEVFKKCQAELFTSFGPVRMKIGRLMRLMGKN